MTKRGDCGEVPGEEGGRTRRGWGNRRQVVKEEPGERRGGKEGSWHGRTALPWAHDTQADGVVQKGEREATFGIRSYPCLPGVCMVAAVVATPGQMEF